MLYEFLVLKHLFEIVAALHFQFDRIDGAFYLDVVLRLKFQKFIYNVNGKNF